MKMVYLSFRWNIFLKVTILSDKRNCVLILIWITVFKKLSETLRIIVLPILLIVSNWFWLNFYTMKFSRFNCRISDSLFILPHPGNIVKRFFQLFSKYLFARLTHAVFTGCLRQLDYITTFSHSRQGGFSSFFDILLFLFLYMPKRSSECTLHFSIYNVRKSSAYFSLPCFFHRFFWSNLLFFFAISPLLFQLY